MAIPGHHTLNTLDQTAYSPSVGATPVVAYARSPLRGTLRKFTCVLGGTLTADATVTVAINGTSAGTFVLTASGSVAGSFFSGTPSSLSAAAINEDDVISFTSASGTGASIPGFYSVAIREG